jgi:cytochrome c peroxidase
MAVIRPRSSQSFVRLVLSILSVTLALWGSEARAGRDDLEAQLRAVLRDAGCTGRIESTLTARLGRPLDPKKVELGRLLFFDKILGLHNDNSCAGCHNPANGFGDSQPIAIGVQNNNVVGPDRHGPRNQRRSPAAANTAFYPAFMWTARFVALSGDPFDNSLGFQFPVPPPEDLLFEQTLGIAQASLPSTELVEMAGFTGVKNDPGSLGPEFSQFDDGKGEPLPPEDATGTRNAGILARVTERINAIPEYLKLFGDAFNNGVPFAPGQVDIHMRREALGEFQMAITAANAPLDQFARGDAAAMSAEQKRGALLFFGKAGCVDCHAVAGEANEMFSDFKLHRIAGPQVFPDFGVGKGNVAFENGTEDFGEEETSGDPSHRYMFRTAPLRNLAVAVAFFHNGAFGSIENAIKHHLNPIESARNYNPKQNHLASDLHVGPIEPVLAMGIDPLLQDPLELSQKELQELTAFVSQALLDPKVFDFCTLVPKRVPSGLPLQKFQGCEDD